MKLKISVLLLGSLFLLSACTDTNPAYQEALEKIAVLEDERSEFESEKDLIKAEYNEVIETLNDIDITLLEIDSREKEMESLIGDLSGKQLQRELILSKINALKDKNVAAQKTANELQAKLNNMDPSDDEVLNKMIAQYEQKLKAKDEEIKNYEVLINQVEAKLKFTEDQLSKQFGIVEQQKEALEKQNMELMSMNQNLEQNILDIEKKEQFIADCAKAYYVAGSKKALKQGGLIKKIGLKLTPDYQKKLKRDHPINFYKKTEIETKGEIQAIFPERDPSSYSIKGNILSVKKVDLFWQAREAIIVLK